MTKQTRITPSLLAVTALSITAVPAHADASTDEAVQAQLHDHAVIRQGAQG